jgi:hypothetical protein
VFGLVLSAALSRALGGLSLGVLMGLSGLPIGLGLCLLDLLLTQLLGTSIYRQAVELDRLASHQLSLPDGRGATNQGEAVPVVAGHHQAALRGGGFGVVVVLGRGLLSPGLAQLGSLLVKLGGGGDQRLSFAGVGLGACWFGSLSLSGLLGGAKVALDAPGLSRVLGHDQLVTMGQRQLGGV